MKSVRWDAHTILSVCDAPDQSVEVEGKVWRFDFDAFLGPLWLRADGMPRACQNPNKAVWRAWERWYAEWSKTKDGVELKL